MISNLIILFNYRYVISALISDWIGENTWIEHCIDIRVVDCCFFIVLFITSSFLYSLLIKWLIIVEVLIGCKWESTTNCISGIGHWIIFYVCVSKIIINSNTWFILCFTNKALSHGILHSLSFIKISSLFIRMNNRSSLKLRFLILRIVLNCSVFFVKVTKVFVIFWVLVIVIWIESFVSMNRNSMKSCGHIVWLSKQS